MCERYKRSSSNTHSSRRVRDRYFVRNSWSTQTLLCATLALVHSGGPWGNVGRIVSCQRAVVCPGFTTAALSFATSILSCPTVLLLDRLSSVIALYLLVSGTLQTAIVCLVAFCNLFLR